MNRILLATLVAAFALNSIACAHTVTVQTTDPGAEIFVDGRPIGRSPATFTEEPGFEKTYTVTAKQHGREYTQSVTTTETNWQLMGAWLGSGALTACGSLFFVPAYGLGCIGLASAATTPFIGYMATKQSPNVITIDTQRQRQSSYREEARAEEEPITMPAVRRGYGY